MVWRLFFRSLYSSNPFAVLRFKSYPAYKSLWSKTASSELIVSMLKDNYSIVKDKLDKLINNGKVKINLNTEIKYNSKLDNKSSIFRI